MMSVTAIVPQMNKNHGMTKFNGMRVTDPRTARGDILALSVI